MDDRYVSSAYPVPPLVTTTAVTWPASSTVAVAVAACPPNGGGSMVTEGDDPGVYPEPPLVTITQLMAPSRPVVLGLKPLPYTVSVDPAEVPQARGSSRWEAAARRSRSASTPRRRH